MSAILYVFDVSKQLCNRLLETFVWTKMLITTERSGLENFFNLRCPQYANIYDEDVVYNENDEIIWETVGIHKSKKDFLKNTTYKSQNSIMNFTTIDWLKINKGQAEIHMMELAECMYDAFNNSVPKLLKPGQWHIPFEDKIDIESYLQDYINKNPSESYRAYELEGIFKTKISTAMAAHTSYTTVGNEPVKSYEKWIELHDNLISYEPPHSSPMEHCSKAMSEDEYYVFVKGRIEHSDKDENGNYGNLDWSKSAGWCNNVKGFIPYRYFIDNKIKI
jgi:hypothetical protein